jgi:serine/threonine protein kinase/tetratricopeptide (TPR) repeat protein
MGVVYKALDTRLDRFVALKFLHEKYLENKQALGRFEREARVVSALNHPKICVIHEVDSFKGQPFIAMEFLQGETLAHVMKKSQMEVERILDLGIQVTEGLEEAHSKGVIHRDIKPSNIMVIGSGHVKILDFGLAKLTQLPFPYREDSSAPTLDDYITDQGVLLGTISYMSPEQALGKEVDHRSDLFSLGVLLYEMAAGTLPFQGETLAGLCDELIHRNPISVLRLNPKLPEEFEGLYSRVLEKDPRYRFQSASDLRAELSHLKHQIDMSATPLPAARPKRKMRGIRKLARLGILVLLAVVLILPGIRNPILHFFGISGLPPEKHIAVLPFELAEAYRQEHQMFFDGLANQMTRSLVRLEQFQDQLLVVPFSEISKGKITSSLEAHREFNVTLVVYGSVETDGEEVTLLLDLIDADRTRSMNKATVFGELSDPESLQKRTIRELIDMLEITLGPEADEVLAAGYPAQETARSLFLRADGFLLRYDDSENLIRAEDVLVEALRIDPNYADARAALGETYRLQFEDSADPKWIEQAEKECLRAIELDADLVDAHVLLGKLRAARGFYEEAQQTYEVVLELNPRNADAYRGLAESWAKQGDTQTAEATYKAAIALRPGYWPGYHELAMFYFSNERLEEALQAWQQVRDLIPESSSPYSNLGAVNFRLHRYEEAREFYETAIEKDSSDVRPYYNLGTLLYFQGNYEEAARAFENAIELADSRYLYWAAAGDTYRELGDLESSRYYHGGAVDRVRGLVELDPNDARAKARLADYLIQLGETEEGLDYLEETLQMDQAENAPWFMQLAGKLYEQVGNRDLAIDYLIRAVELGSDRDLIEDSPILSRLIKDPQYQLRIREFERSKEPQN